jgi:acetyl-CoA acyltransferase
VASKGCILAGAVASVEPRTMGLGPVPASQKTLAEAGLSIDQINVIEIYEAIAVGHPLGVSGACIIQNALTQLEANQGRYALVIERVKSDTVITGY